MHLISTLFVGALFLVSGADAAATTKSFVTCITKNGPKPVATVKTASRILTVPFYGFKFTTTTPTRVITPAPTTTTVTVTWTSVTTLTSTQVTDTFSETITTTDTITATSTDMSSVTSSNTVTVTLSPVTTLAAPAGFQPVRSVFPNSAKRRSDNQAKDALNGSVLAERAQGKIRLFFKDGKAQCSPAIYPTAVTCAGIAKVITTSTVTRTAKIKTVTASTPTSSVTTTTSSTRTTTLTPVRASTTLSFTTGTVVTETEMQASTITIFSTQTVEVVEPTSTYYAACSPENIVSKIDGLGIASFSVSPALSFQDLNAASPYECCTSCMNTSGCAGTIYAQLIKRCFLVMQASGVCSLDAPGAGVERGTHPENWVISNGLCGRYIGVVDTI